MQVTGLSKDAMREAMDRETMGKKCCIAINSAIHLVFAGVVGVVFVVWWKNMNHIDSDDYSTLDNQSGNAYDLLPLIYAQGSLFDKYYSN